MNLPAIFNAVAYVCIAGLAVACGYVAALFWQAWRCERDDDFDEE